MTRRNTRLVKMFFPVRIVRLGLRNAGPFLSIANDEAD
jgi:hypothetical protein